MPSISSRLTEHPEPIEGPVLHPEPRPVPPLHQGPTPVINTVLRCPLPTVVTPSVDNLRQFYGSGPVPQYRYAPPSQLK